MRINIPLMQERGYPQSHKIAQGIPSAAMSRYIKNYLNSGQNSAFAASKSSRITFAVSVSLTVLFSTRA